MTRLDEVPWPSIPSDALVLVPIGSTEQHGPHLPFTVDTDVASAVAVAVADRVRAVVAPAVAYGSSGEHQGFPGTLSIGRDALHLLLVELVRSASTWAARVVLVNGHGGNVPVLSEVVPTLRAEGHEVSWLACGAPIGSAPGGAAPGDAHAGRTETALMLHLDAEHVGDVEHVVGSTEPLDALMPRLRAGALREVAPSGVLGDPRGASAVEGAALLERLIDDAVARIERGRVGERGDLQGSQ